MRSQPAGRFGRADLPEEQRVAQRKAVRWEIFTICYTIFTITAVAFVVGNSQAMKTAWIEDMLSLIPQIAFLTALLFVRRAPSRQHPYGLHRAMGVGHLVAGVALLAVGGTRREGACGPKAIGRPRRARPRRLAGAHRSRRRRARLG